MNTLFSTALATMGLGLLLLPIAGLALFLAGAALGLVGSLTGSLFPED